MQTFLPYPDFQKTAKCLDYKRLGKQRVEAYQILEIILGKESRWKNHPAVLMWKGYEKCLSYYGSIICLEWRQRGFNDTLSDKFTTFFFTTELNYIEPLWLGYNKFHLSHKSNLLRKFPEHYRKLFPNIPYDLPYYWPVKKEN